MTVIAGSLAVWQFGKKHAPVSVCLALCSHGGFKFAAIVIAENGAGMVTGSMS